MISKDHVHLFISALPNIAVNEIMHRIKRAEAKQSR
ncbi:transposase [Pelagibaculum spongiae]|uniref:Transposase IS200-like domain-containing protein n=1 Tax=Pelagibaculum spongiae TaxID=2080658 RepID=A0A2V1H755_9GAMM|nr:hypothetical protein DC094_04165 [Pelagibaculum spongiae]